VIGTMPDAVSLFSGCGGFCEGIELAGFTVKAAVEIDRFAAETYRYNFGHSSLLESDIRGFLGSNLRTHRHQFDLGHIDLVFGGPPCQGYSQIGTRDLADERNGLYNEFARVVEELRPRIFLMENVPNLLLLNKGHFRDLILRKFRSIGYSNTTFLKVSAADFGVPQIRQRVFFFGTRDEQPFPYDLQDFSERVLARMTQKQHFTVWDAIGDLPAEVVKSGETIPYPRSGQYTNFQKMMRLDSDYPPYKRAVKRHRGIGTHRAVLHNHHTKEIQERRKHLISFLKPGEKADSLPKEIWNGRRPEKWRRLHPDLPSYTILAQMHRDLSEWVHPKLERWITVREAARLQSFHDGFVFVGSEWQQLKQIGNAVPPLLAFAAGKLARQILLQFGDARKPISVRAPIQYALPVLHAQFE
jgi:DNA (cytosine-5)-methyltransferase 1